MKEEVTGPVFTSAAIFVHPFAAFLSPLSHGSRVTKPLSPYQHKSYLP